MGLRARSAFAVPLLALVSAACGGGAPAPNTPSITPRGALPDVRVAPGKPPLLLVAREGDPAAALGLAVTTTGLASAPPEAPEIATALAGVVEARLGAAGVAASVVPAWDGYRATVLARSDAEASAAVSAIRDALLRPVGAADLAPAKRKLAALAARPLRDAALAPWARCVGSPFAAPDRAAKVADGATVEWLEARRKDAHGTGRVALSVVGPRGIAEATWTTIRRAAPFPEVSPEPPEPAASGRAIGGAVYETTLDGGAPLEVHVTIDVPTASASVALAEALGDAQGPLAARLAALDPPFRLREVAGTAHPRRGCVGVVLDAAPPRGALAADADVAGKVADAVALVHAEARVHLDEGAARLDGRALARRAGDAATAAERAAWWGLVAPEALSPSAVVPATLRGTVALGLSSRHMKGTTSPRDGKDGRSADARGEALAAAIERATSAWQKPVVEGRTRVEAGQGETWLLFGSPCGTDAETDTDAGLAAVFTVAAAQVARATPDARVEPWISPDGVGLVVHGPAREGESAAAHARRLADVVGRAFAAEPVTPSALTRARTEVARTAAPPFVELAAALAPRHPSWVAPFGREDVAMRASDAALVARAASIRSGPLRLAVLADDSAAQADAALRGVDRWVERRGDAAPRACAARAVSAAPKPGTYVASIRGGASPEVWLAYPFAGDDLPARDAATLVAAALDGPDGLLERALGGATPLATSWQARVVGWPRSPALAIRIVATDAALDGAVLQVRALVDRIRAAGLAAADRDRAAQAAARARVASALDPRTRLVLTFRGEPVPTSSAAEAPSAEAVRSFAAASLGEDGLVVVAARAPRGSGP